MGKHDAFSPKAIANRIKSKGLQKLRWYCEMCQKQCRDANGFKCHTTSEAHQRQLLLFGENPNGFLGTFSSDFEKGYMDILRRQYGGRRVAANQVYQEYIKDKQHVHMNATKWMSLTGFVTYLGKSGKAVVDNTEKGWFVKYIERDPEELARQDSMRRRDKVELDDEERTQKAISEQVQKALEERPSTSTEFTELQRDEEHKGTDDFLQASSLKKKKKTEENLEAESLPSTFGSGSTAEIRQPLKFNALSQLSRTAASSREPSLARSTKSLTSEKRKSSLEQIVEEEIKRKRMQERKDYWLCENIVVKLTTKRLGDEFFNKKGVVKELKDKHTGLVELFDDKQTRVQLDDVHVQTVLPALGRTVMVVNGPYRGSEAVLNSIDEGKNTANIKLTTGPFRGTVVEDARYDDISKLHVKKD